MKINEERPSYCKFDRIAVEDRPRTLEQGHFMTKDRDIVIITPIGSKDEIPMFVEDWLAQMEQQVREERLPRAWMQQYKEAYQAWKKGEEIPVNGTPIKGWQLLSPAQQANVIAANIKTVEDLAQASGEAKSRIGMGAEGIVAKAKAWLEAAAGAGKAANTIVKLQGDTKRLEAENNALLIRNQEMAAELAALRNAVKSQDTAGVVA